MPDLDGWIEVCQVGKDESTRRWEIKLQRSGGWDTEVSFCVCLGPSGVLEAGSLRSEWQYSWMLAGPSSE